MKPIALQLYSLREQAKGDFVGVLKAVAEMGYVGVEPAGLHGMAAEEVREVLDDLGLVCCSMHGPFPTKENVNQRVDEAAALGTDLIISGLGPKDFETGEAPGWTGRVGLVTVLLDDLDLDIPNCYAFTCGPEIMLRFVTLKLVEKGFADDHIYLSMNRKMSCGMGICGRCNIGPIYLCKDGPDVCYAEVKDYPNLF